MKATTRRSLLRVWRAMKIDMAKNDKSSKQRTLDSSPRTLVESGRKGGAELTEKDLNRVSGGTGTQSSGGGGGARKVSPNW